MLLDQKYFLTKLRHEFDIMIVSAWSNGDPNNETGTGYGIRLNKGQRNRFFEEDWNCVIIKLKNNVSIEVNLSDSFWKNCTELRSSDIGEWLLESDLAPWGDKKPPNWCLNQ